MDIVDYIALESPPNAAAVLDRIHEKIEALRFQPLMGHRRAELARGIRCVKSDGYMVFNRLEGAVVRVSRVVHHSRNLSRLKFD